MKFLDGLSDMSPIVQIIENIPLESISSISFGILIYSLYSKNYLKILRKVLKLLNIAYEIAIFNKIEQLNKF